MQPSPYSLNPVLSAPARSSRRVAGLWPWAAALLSGLLLALSFPGWDQGWLIWIALTPLLAAVWLGPRPARRAWLRDALLGYVAGFLFFTVTFHWLGKPLADLFQNPWLIALPPLLASYLALFIGFWAWFIGLLPFLTNGDTRFLTSGRNVLIALLAALAWVGQEWVRGWLFGGFGWNGLGVALHRNLALIQIADIAGLPGLSFLVAVTNVIALITVRRFVAEIGRIRIRPHWDFSVMMASIVATFAYGVRALLHPVDAPAAGTDIPLRFAAVQPAIPESFKDDPAHIQAIYDQYDSLSHTALAWQPQLLLWPEAATLTDIFDPGTYAWLQSIDASTDASFIFGSFLSLPTQGDYNIAACFTDHGGSLQIYRKMHLVPFGEYIPLRHSFPLFAKIAGQLVPGDMEPGKELTIFRLVSPSLRVAPLICFEDTVGDQTRRMALGAQLLVNITNDSWFGTSPGPYQHLCNAFFRTIEDRRPMIRDSNTGVTCLIDAEGRVLQILRDEKGGTYFQGILFGTASIPSQPPTTLYMLYGDWLPVLGVIVSAGVIAFRFLGPHRWKPSGDSPVIS